MSKFKLLAIGTPVLDYFANVDDKFLDDNKLVKGSSNFMKLDRFDQIEDLIGKEIVTRRAGDNARNISETFAHLEKLQQISNKTVAYSGTISDDEVGYAIELTNQAYNIHSLLIKKTQGHSGRIMCLITPDKQRTFAVCLGISEDYIEVDSLPDADYVFFTSISALTPAQISVTCSKLLEKYGGKSKIAISLESPLMLDANKEKAVEVAKTADILFMNEEECAAIGYSEKTVGTLAPLVYLKKGKNGVVVYKDKMVAHVPATIVENVVDTTGAGDTFAAGVLWGLTCGKNEIDAAKIGHRVAGATVSQIGNSIPEEFAL